MRKTTGPAGRFEVSFMTTGPKPDVIAMAPGFGLGYYLKGQPIRLRSGDLPINGRLVDLEGRPVAGVIVRLHQVSLPLPEDAPADTPESCARRISIDGVPALPDGVVTDRDGRFRIEGLGRDVGADLRISGPTVAFKRVQVITRLGDASPGNRGTRRRRA